MELFIDTADLEKIRTATEYYPVSGVTTNPTILRKEGDVPLWDHLLSIKEIIGNSSSLHVQVVSDTADGIISECHHIADRLGLDVYVKIPVTREGLRAMRILSSDGFHITATAIYTELQGVLALLSGADYLAVYYNRMENNSIDADGVIKALRKHVDANGRGRILGASYKNVRQILSSWSSGAHAVTCDPDILDGAISSALVADAVSTFRKDWEEIRGEGTDMVSF